MKKITVAGGGVLGSQIAYYFAANGLDVTLYDINEEAISAAKEKMSTNAQNYAEYKEIEESGAQEFADSIDYSDNLEEAVKDADLVIESITEDIEIKKDFYSELREVASEDTLFSTNTSSLLPSDYKDETGRPEKFLGFHFSNPIWEMPIAEVMATPDTDDEVVDKFIELAEDNNLHPVVVHKEVPGYLLNSLLIPWLEGGQQLYADEIASVEDIDKTWIVATEDRGGPLGAIDIIGLETALSAAEGRLEDNEDIEWADQSWRPKFIEKMKERREENLLGVAEGKGFYTYPDPAYEQEEFFENDPEIQKHKHPFKTVTVAGGGVLGSQIAYQVARAGIKTIQYDINDEALDAAKKRVESYIPRVIDDIDFDPEEAKKDAESIIYTADLEEAFGDTDLVIEAVPESSEIKRQFYTDIKDHLPERTVLVTNSSTLRPSSFSELTGRPEKFAALHFANNIWVNNTGEVMKTEDTSDDVFKDVQSFTDDIGMLVISLYKEQPAYVLNTLLIPFLRAAVQLFATGVATPQEIDKAWEIGHDIYYGPFAVVDSIGVRTLLNIYKENYSETGLEADEKAIELLTCLQDNNELGHETGIGFYDYSNGKKETRDWEI